MNRPANRLLAQLDPQDLAPVLALCQRVDLLAGQTLSSPHQPRPWVYFLLGATVVSLIGTRGSGQLAVGLTGIEGAVGLSYALGLGPGQQQLQVLTSGPALRMPAHALAALMDQRPTLVMAIMRDLWRVHSDTSGLLGRLQALEIPARLALWLSLIAERAGSTVLALTQAQLAGLLGVRRVSITLAIQVLRENGLIECQRGQITVREPDALARLGHRH